MKKILIALLLVSSFVMPQARWYSENKVINSMFTGGYVGWSLGANWFYSSNAIYHTVGSTDYTSHTTTILTTGKTYKLTYEVIGTTAGNVKIYCGGGGGGTSRTTNGIYTEYLLCVGTPTLFFIPSSSWDGGIDNVSVQEVLLSSPIAKAKTNFVTTPPSSINEPNCVFAYTGNNPVQGKIIDASGNGNNGTLYGGTIYAGGLDGGLQFNGTSSYVSVASGAGAMSLIGSGDLTLEWYGNLVADNTDQALIQKELGAGTYKGTFIFFTGNKIRGGAYNNVTGSDYAYIQTSSAVSSGYRHIIFTRTGLTKTDWKIYIDGILQVVTTSATNLSTLDVSNNNPLVLGRSSISDSYQKGTTNFAKLYNTALSATQVKDKWNKIANRPYYWNDLSDLTTANYQRDFTRISGTFTVVQVATAESNIPKNGKYLNCTSSGSVFFTTGQNVSSQYMTYDYYTGGSWSRKAGLVSALSTAEATMDYNATNRKLTFIMATNDRISNIKILRGVPVQ